MIYELIPRCFADGNGDGIGDLDGLRQRLDYLHWLGVDAVWMTPICDSPLRDGGYDITDYKAVHPDLGDLQALDALIAHAHGLGLKVLFDLVLNHTSDMHLWFQRARWAERDSPERNFMSGATTTAVTATRLCCSAISSSRIGIGIRWPGSTTCTASLRHQPI